MSARDRTVVLVALGAAALAAFWFAALAPKRQEAARLSEQVVQQRVRLERAQQLEATARQARARYDKDYATVARLGKAVPVQEDVPSLVYQLDSAAKAHKIDFRDLKLTTPVVAPAGATPSAQVAQAGAAEKGADGSAPTAAASPPTVGAAALPVMPFSFTFNGRYFDMQRFIRALDRLTFLRADTLQVAGRLLTINGLSLTIDPTKRSRVQAQVEAHAFQVPADEGLTDGASPRGPASATPAANPQGTTATTATATGVIR